MSSNILFKVPGRNTNYMPIDVNASKQEILELYARQSFSTLNTWPYASPLAGYYDVKNSPTKLILLNNKKTWSHLRGKTSAKRESLGKDKNYDWVEREYEMKKTQDSNGDRTQSSKSKLSTDPDRHFSHMGCSYKKGYLEDDSSSFFGSKLPKPASSISSKPHISVTVSSKKELTKAEEQDLLNYLISVGKRTTGLQDKLISSAPPSEFRSSYNLNHPDLKRDQRLYLKNLCDVYSVKGFKEAKQYKYLSLLEKQRAVDLKKKEKYKMHPSEDFDSYKCFITHPRPVPTQINCGYIDPRKPMTASIERSNIYKKMHATDSSWQNISNNSFKAVRALKDSSDKTLVEQDEKMSPKLIEGYLKKSSGEESIILNNNSKSHSSIESKKSSIKLASNSNKSISKHSKQNTSGSSLSETIKETSNSGHLSDSQHTQSFRNSRKPSKESTSSRNSSNDSTDKSKLKSTSNSRQPSRRRSSSNSPNTSRDSRHTSRKVASNKSNKSKSKTTSPSSDSN